MLPHKTARGAAALEKLKIFEGCPYPYSQRKKKCVPRALKVLRLRSGRKFCLLGDLASSVGWNQADVVKRLEKKREEKSSLYYKSKVKLNKAINKKVNSLKEV